MWLAEMHIMQLEKNKNTYQTVIYILACLSSAFGILHLFGDIWFLTYTNATTIISDLLLTIIPLVYLLAYKKIKILPILVLTGTVILYNNLYNRNFFELIQITNIFSLGYSIASLIPILFFILVIKDEIIVIYKKYRK